MLNQRLTLGVILTNRNFFADTLVASGRQEIMRALAEVGIEAVILDEDATYLGAVESYEDAKKCAALFKSRREEIDGILISLPNFGNEKGVADAVRLAGLNV